MTVRLGVRELRDTLTATIRRVRAGETIEVTHHGEPVAVLAPISADRIDQLAAAPDIALPSDWDGIRPLLRRPRFPVTGQKSASQAVEDDRAER